MGAKFILESETQRQPLDWGQLGWLRITVALRRLRRRRSLKWSGARTRDWVSTGPWSW
jgi:hypothetical protein